MKKKFVLDILKEVEAGRLSADDALTRLKLEPIEELGFARVDLHRELRQGATEVIYGQGKTPEQISKIIGAFFNDTAPTDIDTLPLHSTLPTCTSRPRAASESPDNEAKRPRNALESVILG